MIYKVIEQIKTGSIKNVVLYGAKALPSPPFVVVKEEPIGGRGTHLRVFTHMLPGQQKFLRTYNRKELLNLLEDFEATSDDGNHNIVLTEESIGPIILDEESGTISTWRLFLIPDLF